MTTDKMRKAIPEEFHEWNSGIAGNENQEICRYRLQGWQAACASNAAEIVAAKCALGEHPDTSVDIAERISQLRDEGRSYFHSLSNLQQQLAAKDKLLLVALEALKHYTDVVVSINDPNDFTPKVSDAGNFAKEAITLLERRDEE